MIEEIISHAYTKPMTIAFAGGFIINMMNLNEDSKRPKNERTTKDTLYWIMFAFWPFAALLLSYLYLDAGNRIGGWLAFHIGVSSPIILQSLMDKVPTSLTTPQDAEPG